ncbi:ubiquinone biosynthesis hydrox [Ceratobasidium sp. AG-I]|nr:ubiquinone biosynthesis hydrox [Ceratobasidium sp. AG-I]
MFALRSQVRCLPRARWASSVAAQEYDIVVIGGGPAGLALAAGIGSNRHTSQLKTALVEASSLDTIRTWSQAPDQYSNRVSSLTNESLAFIQGTGSWEYVDSKRVCPVEGMQVWDGISDARIQFLPSDLARLPTTGAVPHAMASMTENLNLQRGLLKRLDQLSAVDLLDKIKVESIEHSSGVGNAWPVVKTSDGRSLRCRLLVGADGFNSPVRKFAGIKSSGYAYDTHAVVATLFHPERINHPTLAHLTQNNTTAFQRFLPTGPIACLPLSPTASSLVWSTTPAIAGALKASPAETLAIFVNAAFRLPEPALHGLYTRLLSAHQKEAPLSPEEARAEVQQAEVMHSIPTHDARSLFQDTKGVPPSGAEALPPLVIGVQDKSVAGFPLKYSHAETYVGSGPGARTVLVGDAAHTVHPLAGQGLNMGLADASALVECLDKAISTGGDIGSYTALLPYTQARYMPNQSLLLATDVLHKLYGTTAAPVVWARSTGLEVVNELGALKGALMGVAGASPGRRDAAWWNAAASGVEGLSGVADIARAVGGGLKDMLAKAGENAAQSVRNVTR